LKRFLSWGDPWTIGLCIPTGDAEVLALSKYQEILSPYFRMPVVSFETINLLVNKKRFFQGPRTWFGGSSLFTVTSRLPVSLIISLFSILEYS
jgi:hypothetical protein